MFISLSLHIVLSVFSSDSHGPRAITPTSLEHGIQNWNNIQSLGFISFAILRKYMMWKLIFFICWNALRRKGGNLILIHLYEWNWGYNFPLYLVENNILQHFEKLLAFLHLFFYANTIVWFNMARLISVKQKSQKCSCSIYFDLKKKIIRLWYIYWFIVFLTNKDAMLNSISLLYSILN